MIPRNTILLVAAIFSFGGVSPNSAHGEDVAPKLIPYQKDGNDGLGLFTGTATHAYGYRDKQLPNGNWLVSGLTRKKVENNARLLATYRASEIAYGQRKQYVQIVRVISKELLQDLYINYGGPTTVGYGSLYSMEVSFSDQPGDGPNCKVTVMVDDCKTIEVASAMREIAPYLRFKRAKKQ